MIIIFSILLIALLYALYEYRNIKVRTITNHEFNVTVDHDMKILYLSDIQYDLYGKFFQHKLMLKLVSIVNSLEPDLILFGGDYIHHQAKEYPVFKYIKMMHAKKIGILGNHDYNDKYRVMDLCKEAGVELLINEVTHYRDINIIGLDDLREGQPSLPETPDGFNILLIHEPDDFETQSLKDCFDITLAGHLHGGQVTLFGLFAPILPSKYKQKYKGGFVKTNKQTIYVTKGLGGFVAFLPIRFFAQPEVVFLKLSKATYEKS